MKKPFLRCLRALAVLVIGAVFITTVIERFDLPSKLLSMSSPVTSSMTLAVLVGAVLAVAMPLHDFRPDRKTRIAALLGMAALAITVPFTFISSNFGAADVETMLVMVSGNRTTDLAGIAMGDFLEPMAATGVLTGLAVLSGRFLLRTLAGMGPIMVLLPGFAIFSSHVAAYTWRTVFPDPAGKLISVDDLKSPQIIKEPEDLPNLVVLYLESLERTYRDIPATADAFAYLAGLEEKSFSARNQGQINGTHYSAAGIVASQCGVPLMPRGFLDPRSIKNTEDAEQLALDAFLPGVVCLGDLLAQRDYTMAYLDVSDASMFGLEMFWKTHGVPNVRGLKTEAEFNGLDSVNTWGVPDDVLFAEAREELLRMAELERPFALFLLTVSTHGPDGFDVSGCNFTSPVLPEQSTSGMPEAIYCTGQLVRGFLDELDKLGLADDTVVVVLSDHLAMKNTLESELASHASDRQNLFAILNSKGPRVQAAVTRASSSLDVFPTIVEAMGFTLSGGAGNLGRSLVSDQPTFAETLGLDLLDRALSRNGAIQARVWGMGD